MTSLSFVVPVLLGGQRLPNKNLLLLDGQPLCSYVINTLSKVVDSSSIYLSYEDEIVRQAIQRTEPSPDINYLKRDPARGGSACTMNTVASNCNGNRCQVHDHYLYDICKFLDTDWIIQVHTTSPLISEQTITSFIDHVSRSSADQILSVVSTQKECFISNNPVNFDYSVKTPTQALDPLQTVCWAITAWRRLSFIQAFENLESPSYLNNIEFFEVPSSESDDIDTLEEFNEVDIKIRGQRLSHKNRKPIYFDSKITGIERELEKLLQQDGSAIDSNALRDTYGHITLLDIINLMGKNSSWSYPVMVDGQDQACLIQQIKGDKCRNHYHLTKSEFWCVLQGEFQWIMPNQTITVKSGEFMRLRPGQIHTIMCVSDTPGIRFAMGGFNMEHIYV